MTNLEMKASHRLSASPRWVFVVALFVLMSFGTEVLAAPPCTERTLNEFFGDGESAVMQAVQFCRKYNRARASKGKTALSPRDEGLRLYRFLRGANFDRFRSYSGNCFVTFMGGPSYRGSSQQDMGYINEMISKKQKNSFTVVHLWANPTRGNTLLPAAKFIGQVSLPRRNNIATIAIADGYSSAIQGGKRFKVLNLRVAAAIGWNGSGSNESVSFNQRKMCKLMTKVPAIASKRARLELALKRVAVVANEICQCTGKTCQKRAIDRLQEAMRKENLEKLYDGEPEKLGTRISEMMKCTKKQLVERSTSNLADETSLNSIETNETEKAQQAGGGDIDRAKQICASSGWKALAGSVESYCSAAQTTVRGGCDSWLLSVFGTCQTEDMIGDLVPVAVPDAKILSKGTNYRYGLAEGDAVVEVVFLKVTGKWQVERIQSCSYVDGSSCTEETEFVVLSTANVPTKISETSQRCDANDYAACSSLGHMYSEAKGVAQDKQRAASLFKKACNGGNSDGCFRLGETLQYTKGGAKRAAHFYEKACKGGSSSGCLKLGTIYSFALGVPLDKKQGRAIFQKLCDDGILEGCKGVASVCTSSLLAAKGDPNTANIYQNACDGGDLDACADLARRYQGGFGVTKNIAAGATMYKKACDAGHSVSCFQLKARKLSNGMSVLPNSHQFYQGLCAAGKADACYNLGIDLWSPRDMKPALEVYAKACTGGNAKGCYELGLAYTEEDGVKRNPKKAKRFFKRACELQPSR